MGFTYTSSSWFFFWCPLSSACFLSVSSSQLGPSSFCFILVLHSGIYRGLQQVTYESRLYVLNLGIQCQRSWGVGVPHFPESRVRMGCCFQLTTGYVTHPGTRTRVPPVTVQKAWKQKHRPFSLWLKLSVPEEFRCLIFVFLFRAGNWTQGPVHDSTISSLLQLNTKAHSGTGKLCSAILPRLLFHVPRATRGWGPTSNRSG